MKNDFKVLHSDIRILVVDDFPTMRRIVKDLLRKCGFSNFIEAEDGAIGFTKLKTEGPFDMIVSDWNMPNMTGIELLKTVRADEQYKGIPFLMVTAEAEKSNIIEAVKSGVSNYVVKPFTAQTLKEKLTKIEMMYAQKLAG